MRVFLPAALRDQQQSSNQPVYSPSTSSVDTALVCNKSNKKKAATSNNRHEAAVHDSDYRNLDDINEEEEADELLSLDFSFAEKKGGFDSNNSNEECGGSEEEAKKQPAASSSLLSSSSKLSPRASQSNPSKDDNNNKVSSTKNPLLDDRKVAAKREQPSSDEEAGDSQYHYLQPKHQPRQQQQVVPLQAKKKPRLQQQHHQPRQQQQPKFVSSFKSSEEDREEQSRIMGGGGKLISSSSGGAPPPSSSSSLRHHAISSSSSIEGRTSFDNHSNTAAVQSAAVRGDSVRGADSSTAASSLIVPSDTVAPTSAAATVAAAASMPSYQRGPNVAAASASFPQPHDDDNEDSPDEWNDSNNSSDKRQIFIHPIDHNNNNRRGGYKTSSSPRSSSSSAAVAAAAAPTPLLNHPIPGSVDDPATVSKSDIIYLPSSSSSHPEDNHSCRDGAVLYEDNSILAQFARVIRTHNPPLEMVEMDGDGNCLFRAISLQVYGDQGMHAEVRKNCLDFMERDVNHFQDFVADEDFHDYIARKRRIGVHGNHTEIQAMSELYNRSIEVFVPSKGITPINIFHEEYYKNNDADPPIRLLYMDGNHYNALIDPLIPTAGLGLGLPGLQPGLADKLQMDQAKQASDETALKEKMELALKESNRAQKELEEREMKEVLAKSALSMDDAYQKKALYLSEIEAADFDLEQAVLASSLESYRNAEERKPSSRRHESSRRNRYNSSPRGQRSSSNSPIRGNSPLGAASSSAASSTSQYAAVAAAAAASSTMASSHSRSSPTPHAASVASAGGGGIASTSSDEYPASVQELVMNGFELQKVLRAYDLIGDNFDDLLSFLLSQSS